MRGIVTPHRINLSKDAWYWMEYYAAPITLICIGSLFTLRGTLFAVPDSKFIDYIVLILIGILLFLWLYNRLSYKTHKLENRTIDEFRKELNQKLIENDWHLYHDNKKYTLARKRSEIIVVYYTKTTCKWCLTGDFIRFGPLFSIIPYYPKGKRILKELNVCT